jgi:enterochelin esterase-like enzyme
MVLSDEEHGTESAAEQIKEAQRALDALYIKRQGELAKQLENVSGTRHTDVDPTAKSAVHGTWMTPAKSAVQHKTENQLGTDMWKQLNRVSIPTFSGDKRLYGNWRAAFYTCVDAAPATAEYKLLQLRYYLRGEALRAVENLGHSATAYEAAKERLERKYGGIRR